MFSLWTQFQQRMLGKSRPRATTTREDRYLFITVWHNRDATDSQLSCELYVAAETRVSRVTVSRRLHERGLLVRRPIVCVSFSFKHRIIRLKRCRIRDWSMDQLVTVLFSDWSH
ncbi:transposable element Tc1 transposase [Trichonephila clavipes]|nr:transposable element Tc1 transposase [Trichonephila clavipes]